MVFVTGCTTLKNTINRKTIVESPAAYENVEITTLTCRGSGHVISSGKINGRLNYSFTSTQDSSYIQFKDLLGRKTLFLIINHHTFEAWDLLHHQRYTAESILMTLPFLELTNPQELLSILWGKFPESVVQQDENSILTGQIQIYSEMTEMGPLVSRVSYDLDEGHQQVVLTISKREYGEQYPHLIKPIPASIPVVEMDSL